MPREFFMNSPVSDFLRRRKPSRAIGWPGRPDDNNDFILYRLVTAVGDAYGFALLLHMLTTTITLTLLAYQATKVSALPVIFFFQGPRQMTPIDRIN